MPSTCSAKECKRTSCALCHCCQQDICLTHLQEHQNSLISKLNPLVDQTNMLENRVKTLKTENIVVTVRNTLEEWRIDCYKKIDQFVEEKYYQLSEYMQKRINKQRRDIDQVRSKLTELINEKEATRQHLDFLKNKINGLEKEINKLEQTSFHIQLQTFIANDDLIRIKESNPYQLDISCLSEAYKVIDCSKKNWAALATNENVLLMHQQENLCLVDHEFTMIRKALWSFGEVWDMFWSSILKRFIIINENNVFLVDEDTLSIESVQMVAKQDWCCGACSDRSLYLATYRRGSSVMEFNLLPSIEFIKQWSPPDTCSKDEGIHDMIYNDEKIFMIIENQVRRTVRVNLKSSITFNCLWSLLLDSADKQKVQIRCCLFNHDEWIVAYHDVSRLLHITKDGKLKASCSYTPAPHFATTFGTNLLVVVTSNNINLHQI